MPDHLVVTAEITSQRSVICDSGEENQVFGIKISVISFILYRSDAVIVDACEEQMLLFRTSESMAQR